MIESHHRCVFLSGISVGISSTESVCSRSTARAQSQRGAERTQTDRIGSDRNGMDGFGGVGTAAVVRSPPVLRRRIGRRRWPRRAGPVGPVGPVGSRKLRTRAGQEDGGGVGVGEQRSGVRRSSRWSASAKCRDRCTAGGALKNRRGRIGGDEARLSVTGTASLSSPSPDPNGLVDVRGVLTRPSPIAVLFLRKCSRSRRSREGSERERIGKGHGFVNSGQGCWTCTSITFAIK